MYCMSAFGCSQADIAWCTSYSGPLDAIQCNRRWRHALTLCMAVYALPRQRLLVTSYCVVWLQVAPRTDAVVSPLDPQHSKVAESNKVQHCLPGQGL